MFGYFRGFQHGKPTNRQPSNMGVLVHGVVSSGTIKIITSCLKITLNNNICLIPWNSNCYQGVFVLGVEKYLER